MKQISVIIPCYNAEPFLDRCFASLERQTIGIENMELIFVNDASTDGTSGKLLGYEARYPDSVIVVQFDKNCGLGAARNAALEYASASYVGYVDADDWVEPDMYEKMLSVMRQDTYDFVQCRWDFAKDDLHRQQPEKKGTDGIIDLSIRTNRKQYVGERISLVTAWDKIFKKSFLTKHNIFFPEQLKHEDFFFSYLVFLYADRTYSVSSVLYHYYINPSGIVKRRGREYHFDQMTVMLGFLQECIRRGLRDQYPEMVEWMFLEQYYVYMLWKVFDQFPERAYQVYRQMRQTVREWVPNYKENPYRKWECNRFDDVMLKLLDYDLSEEEFEQMRIQFVTKITPGDPQRF